MARDIEEKEIVQSQQESQIHSNNEGQRQVPTTGYEMSTAEGADRQQSTTSPGPSGQYVSASEEVGRRMETIDVSRQQMSTVEIGRQHGRKLVNSEQLNAYTDEEVILQVSAPEVDISRHQSTAKVVPSRQRTPESVEHGRKQENRSQRFNKKGKPEGRGTDTRQRSTAVCCCQQQASTASSLSCQPKACTVEEISSAKQDKRLFSGKAEGCVLLPEPGRVRSTGTYNLRSRLCASNI